MGKKSGAGQGEGKYLYPWEKVMDRVVTPFEEFIHRQSTSAIALIFGAIAAMVIANSPARYAYEHLVHLPVRISLGGWFVERTLAHWVNEGLMALFFLIVGLEIKREVLVGELAEPRKAALPMIAAVGGMLVPAWLYLVLNPNPTLGRGWGIPMATDIAFCVSALVLLGKRVPQALMVFLVALAIVDDLGAVLVIALFYTGSINTGALAAAGAVLALLVVLAMGGIRKTLPYAVCGAVLWYFLLVSGVHATVAGILVAFCIPARPSYHPKGLSSMVRALMDRFDMLGSDGMSTLKNVEQFSILQSIRQGIEEAESPLRRVENALHLPVALLVIPIFALTNSGIHISVKLLALAASHPITHGILAGLVLGKFAGIAGASWLAVKLRVAALPEGMGMKHVAGVGMLGGIGFTMSIFVAELSFGTFPERLVIAKMAIIAASAASAACGIGWLLWCDRERPRDDVTA